VRLSYDGRRIKFQGRGPLFGFMFDSCWVAGTWFPIWRRERCGDKLKENPGIGQWVQFPTAFLLFLVVPNDPASGAFYVFDLRIHTRI
jgi:hypothetical protein